MNLAETQNIIAFVALFLSLASLCLTVWLSARLKNMLKSGDGKSLESAITNQGSKIEEIIKFRNGLVEYLKILDKRIRHKVGNVELSRFNPFQGEGLGGDNSFSASFADEDGNGLVVSALHARERTNVFAKPLSEWQSKNELSKEEKSVVARSKSGHQQNAK